MQQIKFKRLVSLNLNYRLGSLLLLSGHMFNNVHGHSLALTNIVLHLASPFVLRRNLVHTLIALLRRVSHQETCSQQCRRSILLSSSVVLITILVYCHSLYPVWGCRHRQRLNRIAIAIVDAGRLHGLSSPIRLRVRHLLLLLLNH